MSKHTEGGANASRGPRALGDLLGELMIARGLTQARSATEVELAWAKVVGEREAGQTQVSGLRQGILTISVAHSALLEELAAFRKRELLEAMRKILPNKVLRDIRFRIGAIDSDVRLGKLPSQEFGTGEIRLRRGRAGPRTQDCPRTPESPDRGERI